ncbi:MAG: Os1348 family NHLP clan protein [Dehalococcoidia bacterium]|nr:Os1348 family NHLP clan protein [Dehalococcoidia bacterium]
MVENLHDKPKTGNKAMGKPTNVHAVNLNGNLSGRGAVLSVLARASDEPDFMTRLADDPHGTLKEYYTLTQEEKAALASGDIRKIESWVGKLDKRLSTWLLYRLSREKR